MSRSIISFLLFVAANLILTCPGLKHRVKLLNLISNVQPSNYGYINERLLVPYKTGWEWQNALTENLISSQQLDTSNKFSGVVLLLQHRSVYTLGSGSTSTSGPFQLSATNDGLIHDNTALEFDTINVDRAGQATYHGPGQIVLYPLLDLSYFDRDINIYLRKLEQVVINCLAKFDVTAERVEGLTGVWVGNYKVAAMGIKIRRWVTLHGVSLNVNPDMRYFQNIVPCGITADTGRLVGSISQFNPTVTMKEVANELIRSFADEFEVEWDSVDMALCADSKGNLDLDAVDRHIRRLI